eukprot:TRINITY_DN9410_c0_g1_i1.p1 TRINITY_DN9410_c0_g1~~TRINITY_DN9410_c0_g1_i1.p1  ORF type:complete len:136 (+),score=29.45 TRINITY_DN9410_c0_g1_i1:85-492(+)
MPYTFFIMVGAGDAPIFELECNTDATREDRSQLKHFIIHAALDNIDEIMWSTPSFYLKNADSFKDFHISAYISPGYVRFLLMQDREIPDTARSFFAEVNELYLKVLLNPFYQVNTRISSQVFKQRVGQLVRKYFP